MSAPVVASVTVGFGGSAFGANIMAVALADAAFVLAPNAGMVGSVPAGLTNLALAPARLAVASGLGALLDGQLTLAIAFAPGTTPQVTLFNVSGGAPTITYPTTRIPVTQALTPGTALPLDDIVGT